MTYGSDNLQNAIFKPTPETAKYFAEKTRSLVDAKSFGLMGGRVKNVDIVKDVINLLPVHWISHIVSGENSLAGFSSQTKAVQLGLPLKWEKNPGGAWDEESICKDFANIARCVQLWRIFLLRLNELTVMYI